MYVYYHQHICACQSIFTLFVRSLDDYLYMRLVHTAPAPFTHTLHPNKTSENMRFRNGFTFQLLAHLSVSPPRRHSQHLIYALLCCAAHSHTHRQNEHRSELINGCKACTRTLTLNRFVRYINSYKLLGFTKCFVIEFPHIVASLQCCVCLHSR